ncbi:MAG: ABC transporter ATP-binding protein [Candidatus Edwardsbacteria bacterium]
MKLVIEFWKRKKIRLILLIVFTMVTALINLSFPYLLKYIIDGVKEQLRPQVLLRYVLLLFLFGLARSVVSVLLPFSRGMTNEKFQWTTRNAVFSKLLRMGHTFINRFPTGDVIERIDFDLHELSWFACSGIFRPIEAIFTLSFGLIILLKIDPLLTMTTLPAVVLGVIIWLQLGPLIYRWYKEMREKISEGNNHLESSFSGIRLVKSYVMEQRTQDQFRQILNERISAASKAIKVDAKIDTFYHSIGEIGIIIILWLGGMRVMQNRLTIGEFVAFNSYILMLIGPMWDIGNFFVLGKRVKVADDRIVEIKTHPPDVDRDRAESQKPIANSQKPNGEIFFSEISFKFSEEDEAVLKGISLELIPGSKIGIAGTVGSGKSTIFRLLLRLAEPFSGRITLGEKNIKEIPLDRLRNLFGYASQDAMLFSDTLYNNILFDRDEIAEEEMKKIVKMTQLEEEIKEFPKGLKELIGERGVRLSGGQKARVAIARAIISKPKILILDDTTSSLDAETEKALIREVKDYLRDSTLLIVSHRLSVLSECDEIIVLDKGKIVEQGNHLELMNRRGLYWKLYRRQLLEEELERI